MSDRETIAALATPAGEGAVCILRLSGAKALEVLERLCPGKVASLSPRRLSLRALVDPDTGEALDQALVVVFPGPASFTGETVVELQAHGGVAQAEALLEATVRAGARPARPGEFSRRAFENGRLDLARAEGLAELISASSTAALKTARGLFGGDLSREVGALLELLGELRARVEASLDFPEQVGEVDAAALEEALLALHQRLGKLAASYRQGQRSREGARVVLLGAPNVGKSSLFNRLCGHERAIVHAQPGTTRDAVEQRVELRGLSVTLVDSAGVREAPEPVEAQGVERSREAAASADLVLWIGDLSSEDSRDEGEDPTGVLLEALEAAGQPAPVLRVQNKADLLEPGERPAADGLEVSARTGRGLEALEAAILEALGHQAVGSGGEGEVLLSLARHAAAVEAALAALSQALELHRAEAGLDALAEELREAEVQLAGILGRVALPEALLDRIFGGFCLGK